MQPKLLKKSFLNSCVPSLCTSQVALRPVSLRPVCLCVFVSPWTVESALVMAQHASLV